MIPHHLRSSTTLLENQSPSAERQHLTRPWKWESLPHPTQPRRCLISTLFNFRSSQTAACRRSLLGACCKISQAPSKSQSKTLLISGILKYISESTPTPREKTSPKSPVPPPNTTEETPWALRHCLFQQWLGEVEAEWEFTPAPAGHGKPPGIGSDWAETPKYQLCLPPMRK